MATLCQRHLTTLQGKIGVLHWGKEGFWVLLASGAFSLLPAFFDEQVLCLRRVRRESLDPDPLPQLIFSEFSREQIQKYFLCSIKKKTKKLFFSFQNLQSKRKETSNAFLNNRCLFWHTPCQLFSGWAVRKLGYGQDTEEQSKSALLLFRSVLFEIMVWIWAWVQSKHLGSLRSRHFSKEASCSLLLLGESKCTLLSLSLATPLSRLWEGRVLKEPTVWWAKNQKHN